MCFSRTVKMGFLPANPVCVVLPPPARMPVPRVGQSARAQGQGAGARPSRPVQLALASRHTHGPSASIGPRLSSLEKTGSQRR